MKKNLLYAGSIIILVFILFSVLTFFQGSRPPVHAQASGCASGGTCLSGWAWSSNLGWISFNSNNTDSGSGSYEVDMDNFGNLSGHAWSSNVGWISFNGTETGAPPSNDTGSASAIANVNISTGSVTGWARALTGCMGDTTTWDGLHCLSPGPGKDNGVGTATSNTGWDGWIHLSDASYHPTPNFFGTGGVTYASSTGIFSGYAWGGNVVGWVQFDPMVNGSRITNPVCVSGSNCGGGSGSLTGICSVTYTDSSGNSVTTQNNVSLASSTGVVTYTASTTNGTGPYEYNNSSAISSSYVVNSTYKAGDTIHPSITVVDSTGSSGDIGQFCPSVTVAGGSNNSNPQACATPAHAIACSSNASTTPNQIGGNGVTSCSNQPYDYCAFSCIAPYHLNTTKTSCINTSTIEI